MGKETKLKKLSSVNRKLSGSSSRFPDPVITKGLDSIWRSQRILKATGEGDTESYRFSRA